MHDVGRVLVGMVYIRENARGTKRKREEVTGGGTNKQGNEGVDCRE